MAPLSAFGGRLDAERFDATLRRMASEHAQLLRTSVADFVARGTDIARVRSLRRDPREYDVAVWRHMAELGWAGMLVSDAHGGSGSLADAAIVAEGVGRALMPEPFTASAVLAAGALAGAQNEALKHPCCRRSCEASSCRRSPGRNDPPRSTARTSRRPRCRSKVVIA